MNYIQSRHKQIAHSNNFCPHARPHLDEIDSRGFPISKIDHRRISIDGYRCNLHVTNNHTECNILLN